MSLLIKALDKAEKAQEEQSKAIKTNRRRASNIANRDGFEHETELDMQLEGRPEHNLTQEFYAAQYAGNTSQQAASVFEAKHLPATSASQLRWMALLGLLAFFAIGAYFYYQLNRLHSAPVASPAPPATLPVVQASSPLVTTEATATPNVTTTAPNVMPEEVALPVLTPTDVQTPEKAQPSPKSLASRRTKIIANKGSPKLLVLAIGEEKIGHHPALSSVAPIASKSVSIQISKAKQPPAVNPTLMNAYDAYVAGQAVEAQALYKQVLQQDARNVDALLGLGTIAETQGRWADATNWYQKVLEIEPRNSIALAAIYSSDLQSNDAGLSKLKSLLAKEPNNANLHAELGNVYAERNDWPEAQQAYFEAYRLTPTAEYAFNLAVGLDQLGKPKLALPYYQEALVLSQRHSNHTIDAVVVQQRIQAIQSQQ